MLNYLVTNRHDVYNLLLKGLVKRKKMVPICGVNDKVNTVSCLNKRHMDIHYNLEFFCMPWHYQNKIS